jgi:hypothetical protein
MTVPLPKTLETPPRTTGKAEQDLPILIDWLWSAYQVIQQSVAYINSQINTADISFANLPDPQTTTLAQAQQTANDAYSLANQADGKGDDNADDIVALDASVATHTADIAAQQALWAGLISGTVTIGAADVGFTVTFGTAQADTDYTVNVQAVSSTGAPVIGAFVIKQKTYTVNDFSVILYAAPGAGAGVTFEWQLIRNT